MIKKSQLHEKIVRAIQLKCPNCGEGRVFEKSKGFKVFPDMNETCNKCNYNFHREPGFFLGAMYASYALAVVEGIVTFVLTYITFPGLSTFMLALIPAVVILLFASRNYKLGRVIWMNIFIR